MVSEHAPASAPAADDTPTGPAAIVGAVLIVVLVVVCVLLARSEDAASATLAAADKAQQADLPQDESARIRTALISAQDAAERVWRASTPPAERRAQEAAMMQRFYAEEQAVVTQQRLRPAGDGALLATPAVGSTHQSPAPLAP